MFSNDVCIVGTGRVGLPLALSLSEVGYSVVGIDRSEQLRDDVNSGIMPFHEPGYKKIILEKKVKIYEKYKEISNSKNIIITVGTPLHSNIESDMRQIESVLESIVSFLKKNQSIILRSTVSPGTTFYIKRWLERNTNFVVGSDIYLAFCPERIAEGKSKKELKSLPQIVGVEDDESWNKISNFFKALTLEVLRTDYYSAELVKLFNNTFRYVQFGLANQFAMYAEHFGVDVYEIISLANHNYPRSNIASPGFTAGTCLRKDFGMLSETNSSSDFLLSVWRVNESMPLFLVDGAEKRLKIFNKKIGILGYTFKSDVDDIRDSLVPKLYRYIKKKLPSKIKVHDPYLCSEIEDPVNGKIKNVSLESAIDADIIFIATNHKSFEKDVEKIMQKDSLVVDVWNVAKTGKIFFNTRDTESIL